VHATHTQWYGSQQASAREYRLKMSSTSDTPYYLLIEDEDASYKYQVTESDYNIYENEGMMWITFYCKAGIELLPSEHGNPEPWVEISIPYKSDQFPSIDVDSILTGDAYDTVRDENLTNIYFFTHEGFEKPQIQIIDKQGDRIKAKINDNSKDPRSITLLAEFTLNPDRSKSFI